MSSKIITKLDSLTPTQKLIILASIITFIASCGIVAFFILTSPDSSSSISSPTSSEDTDSPSGPSIEISNSSASTSDDASSPTDQSNASDTPQLMDTPLENNSSSNQSSNNATPNNQSSSNQSSSNQSTQKPAETTPTTPAPTKTPEELDPICGGKYATSTSCIVQKMYGTQYPGANHPFAYDIANHYHYVLTHPDVSKNYAETINLPNGVDSQGALAMITKDLRQNETDQVSVRFYAYKSSDTWKVDWKVYISKKIGDKSYAVYSQFGKNYLSQTERDAITNRYIPEYTKEFNDAISRYEHNYLTWYNSQK